MGLGSSRIQARQLVNHGHFMVNDRKVNIPSYRVKAGDTIKIKKSSLKNLFFKTLPERLKAAKPVSWLLFDPKEMVGKVLHEPGREDLQSNINVQMIIEFYSK
jgi:small subunit ribosomal protein S4